MAERATKTDVNKTGQDPIVEPPNSTVDDWMVQRVGRDEERADEALREAGGDVDAAADQFDQETERRPGEPTSESTATDGGFGESDIPDPMPESLGEVDQTEHVDEMGGEAPTG